MDDVAGFIGDLLCKIPIGMDQCTSGSGRAELGSGAIIATLGVVAALFFLLRNPRR
jgi:hypothetical protein